MSEPRTTKSLVALGERVLSDSSHIFEDHDVRSEAEQLLAHCLGLEPDELDDEAIVSPRTRERFLSLIARRAGGEPFPFLLGRMNFYGLDLKVRPGSFVPRSSSELLVERALKRLRRRRSPIVVDVCTGAGPIALAVADEVPEAQVWGTDIDGDGLDQARHNARRLEIKNATFRRGDMYAGLPARLRGEVDLITGHVPYVPQDELEDLPAEVREFEPVFTLSDRSIDGLELLRRSALEGAPLLRPGGWLLLEVSEDLSARVRRVMRSAGLEDHGASSDADKLSIIVEGRRPR